MPEVLKIMRRQLQKKVILNITPGALEYVKMILFDVA
jgi:hypothetical protein